MAKLYLQKINNQEINALTGEVWKLEDVPERWYDAVASYLDEDKGE